MRNYTSVGLWKKGKEVPFLNEMKSNGIPTRVVPTKYKDTIQIQIPKKRQKDADQILWR